MVVKMNTICIYASKSEFDKVASQFKSEDLVLFPEAGLKFQEVRELPRITNKVIVTTNPLVCTNYKQGEVFTVVEDKLEVVSYNVYGACFDYASKVLDKNTKCLLSEYIVKEIRDHIAISNQAALDYLSTISESAEKAYLLVKLSNEQ